MHVIERVIALVFIAIVICVVGILLAVRFLYRPDRSTLAGWLTFGVAESKREKGPSLERRTQHGCGDRF